MTGKLRFIVNPLYWPLWLLIAVTWCLVTFLPFRFLRCMGKCFGALAYCFPSYAKTIARINIQRCFPELTPQAQQKLLKENFQSFGMAVFETLFAWWASDERVQRLAYLQGTVDQYASMQQSQKGTLLIVPHLLTLELAGRMVGMSYKISAVYRPHRKPFIDMLNGWHRSKVFDKAIPRQDIRGLIKALRDGEVVLFLPDIDPGRKHAIFSPFFNIPAATVASVSRIAQMSGANVMTAECFRRADGKGYDVRFNDPLVDYPSDDLQKDADQMNKQLEAIIRKAPEQYLWLYRRFATRPQKGGERFYPSSR